MIQLIFLVINILRENKRFIKMKNVQTLTFKIGNDKYIINADKNEMPDLVREIIYSRKRIWPYSEKVKDLNN